MKIARPDLSHCNYRDCLPVSSCGITLGSNDEVMRKKEIIANFRNFQLSNKFTLSVPQEAQRGKYVRNVRV